MSERIAIVEADLNRPDHQAAVVLLTDAYAKDPMGNGKPLATDVRDRLVAGLRRHPTTVILLAYLEGEPVGIATCFGGFSTFYAQPLLNIHDLAVLPAHRGTGIGTQLLAAVDKKARALGCCKLTLEVQENNRRARHTYESAGFRHAVYGDETGGSLFFTKPLT